MRLEMGMVHISDVRFGSRTAIDNHILFIDRQELDLFWLRNHFSTALKSILLIRESLAGLSVCWMS